MGTSVLKTEMETHLRKRQIPTVSLVKSLFISSPAVLRLHQMKPVQVVGEGSDGAPGVSAGPGAGGWGAQLLRPLRGRAQSSILTFCDFQFSVRGYECE